MPEALSSLDVSSIQVNERISFIEDMTTEDKYPEKLAWIRQHAEEVANFDVQARARNFRMRVHQYCAPGPPGSNNNPEVSPVMTTAGESFPEAASTSLATP